MRDLSPFQIFILLLFFVLGAIGVALFAGLGGFVGGTDATVNRSVIWGTADERIMKEVLSVLETSNDGFKGMRYVEKDSRTYGQELLNALAAGSGPDLFLLPHDELISYTDKIRLVPFSAYSERTFRSSFVEEGELYLTEEGLYGLPFAVDPLVLYWNRDIFQSEGISQPPSFWDELFILSPTITRRDRGANIVRSLVALGEFENVAHAKEILSMLILQTGNPIVGRSEFGALRSFLGDDLNFDESPANAALRFYTEFSNPSKSVYSWNRGLPDSRQSFVAGDLALYIGFASELLSLRAANPNLNFDVAEMLQSRDNAVKVNYGRMQAFAIPLTARNPEAAFAAAVGLTSQPAVGSFSNLSGLPPVRRDLLSSVPDDAFGAVFYNAAISSRGWLDPNSAETNDVFARMIESVTSGRARLDEAVNTANEELNNLLQNG